MRRVRRQPRRELSIVFVLAIPSVGVMPFHSDLLKRIYSCVLFTRIG
jgi:hypothetical protein